MKKIVQQMKSTSAADKVAVAVTVVGVAWFVDYLRAVFTMLWEPLPVELDWQTLPEVLLSLFFIIIFCLPGTWFFYRGTKYIAEKCADDIRPGVAAIVVSVALWMPNLMPEPSLPENILTVAFTTIVQIVVYFVIYVRLCQFIIKKDGCDPGRFTDYIGKVIIFIVALDLFLIGSYALTEFGIPTLLDVHNAGWPIPTIAFLSILNLAIPYWFYKFAVKKIEARDLSSDAPPEQPA